MKVYCPKCESPNTEDASVCALCGHLLQRPQERPIAAAASRSVARVKRTLSSKSRAIIALCNLLAAVIAVSFYFGLRSSPIKQVPPSEPQSPADTLILRRQLQHVQTMQFLPKGIKHAAIEWGHTPTSDQLYNGRSLVISLVDRGRVSLPEACVVVGSQINHVGDPSRTVEDWEKLILESLNVPAYRVMSDRIDQDDAWVTKIQIEAFIEERVTADKLHKLGNHLYQIVIFRGPFQYRNEPNCVSILIYARKGQSHIAWGWELKTAIIDSPFELSIRKKMLGTVNDPPVVKFGLTEAQRQMIWRDIVRLEDRAHLEAELLYPYPMRTTNPNYTETGAAAQLGKQLDYATELRQEYRIQLAESLGMTMETLDAIGNEGSLNWWEAPPPPSHP